LMKIDLEKAVISLVLVLLMIYAVLFVYSIPQLDRVFISFIDAPDTAASIKVAAEYGLTGKVPFFMEGEYYMLGNFPPLFPLLGALVYWVVGDALAAAAILNVLVSMAMFYILYAHAFRHLEMKQRLLLSGFFLMSMFSTIYFPLGIRMRSHLAALFGMCTFVFRPKGLPLLALSFLMLLSQPVFGGIFLVLYLISTFEHRENGVWPAFAGMLLALPFYSGLFEISGLPPTYYGCSTFLFNTNLILPVLLMLVGVAFMLKKMRGFTEYLCAFLILLPLLQATALQVTQDPNLTPVGLVPLIKSDLCYPSITYPAIFVLFYLYTRREKGIPKNAFIMFLLVFGLAIMNVTLAYLFVTTGSNLYVEQVESVIAESGGERLATLIAYVTPDGRVYPSHGDFMISSHLFLNDRSIMMHGSALPPMLNKGPVYVEMVRLLEDIAGREGNCAESVEQLRDEGIDTLLYVVSEDNEEVLDESYLDACGLRLLYGEGGWVVYSIKEA